MIPVAFDATLNDALDAATERLDRGRLVAFPTETVYGLGADASRTDAVHRIFAAKGRPSDHPLIVHLATRTDPLQWAREIPPLAARLIDRFWPGPLTLILPRRSGVGEAAAGGQDSIGLRCPSHPVAQELLSRYATLRRTGPIGIAGPSANRFGHVSPTSARHVRDEFGDLAHDLGDAGILVVDGGDSAVGIESTIVDCTRLDRLGPVLLRPGSVTATMIAEAVGIELRDADREAPRASGTLASHYAPNTPLRLVDASDLEAAPDDVVVWAHSAAAAGHRHEAPCDPVTYAHRLYAALRTLDAMGAREIWIERPPPTAEWAGINDRLMRAAAARSFD